MFAGKKVWLVGASVGIGEALALKLAKSGAIVTVSARSVDKLTTLVSQLQGSGHRASAIDVTDYASVQRAWQEASSQGIPDIVIYNAGSYEPMSAREFRLDQAEQMLEVNYHGVLRVLSLVLPAFVARKEGHIVLVGSVAGYSGLPKAIGYGASKAAVNHLAENLRVDLAPIGIKAQLVTPGFVKTRLTDKNSFSMPFMVTPEFAADRIAEGMESNRFEIHFPHRFTTILKFWRILPYSLYFRLLQLLKIDG